MTTAALDEATFDALVQRHRPELHVHCHRMLAGFDDAKDAVQETSCAPGGPATGSAAARTPGPGCTRSRGASAWTSSGAKPRRIQELQFVAEVSWLQPYPDRLLDAASAADGESDAVVVAHERIELAFLGALQVLQARPQGRLAAGPDRREPDTDHGQRPAPPR